jgi:hypothetical protein
MVKGKLPKRAASAFLMFHTELYQSMKKKFPAWFAPGGEFYHKGLGKFTSKHSKPGFDKLSGAEKERYKKMGIDKFEADKRALSK